MMLVNTSKTAAFGSTICRLQTDADGTRSQAYMYSSVQAIGDLQKQHATDDTACLVISMTMHATV